MGQQARLVFDHEMDTRPRRQVADWGGDEVFARTPRKRFKPVVVGAEAAHPAPRPHVAEPVRPRLHVVSADPVELPAAVTGQVDVLVERTIEPALREQRDIQAQGVDEDGAPRYEAGAPHSEAGAAGYEAEAPRWEEERAPNGRRTVLITGRPGAHPAPRPDVVAARRRPPRTVHERLGARPDRVAAWACGLGVTLILAAVATADAATRAL
jgi:hypothetical protein